MRKRNDLSTPGMTKRSPIRKIWHALQDLLFPEECFGCGAHGTYICMRCDMEGRDEQYGASTFSLYTYQHSAIQNALHALKYRECKAVARTFATKIHNALLEELSERNIFSPLAKDKNTILLIPIPLSKARLRERGYNQSLLLAKHLAEHDPAAFSLGENILIKTRETPAQTSLKRAERLKNLSNAFSVADPKVVKNKTIFVIDDVTTTGATLREAARILTKSGAKEVLGVTVARSSL